MPRNPPWTYDELVVALDVYVNSPHARSSKADGAIAQASLVLRSLPIHSQRGDSATFRGVNSVYLKLQNFKTVDPSYSGVGMAAGAGPRERLVWERFSGAPGALAELARQIALGGSGVSVQEVDATDEDANGIPILEGQILLAKHRQRERRAAPRKKQQVLATTGRLACEVCGFDFAVAYGTLGEGFAECHHVTPLAAGVRATRLRDLAIVCSNCHRMMHRRSPLLSLDELREIRAMRTDAVETV